MNEMKSVCITICCTCIAVSILSVLIPQKRTRRVMGLVIGLFTVSTFMTAVTSQLGDLSMTVPDMASVEIPAYSDTEYIDAVAQQTADNLTQALDELLQNEGIQAEDIRLTLKISDEGRISVARAVIYINENDRQNSDRIESIIYRNIAKEPEIHVTGEEAQRVAE